MFQNTQNLKNIERLGSIPQKSTQNLRRQEFLDLTQIERWKCRSCFEDHVYGVRFEIKDFNKLGYKVVWQNPKREEDNGVCVCVRERERDIWRKMSWKWSFSNFNKSMSRHKNSLFGHTCEDSQSWTFCKSHLDTTLTCSNTRMCRNFLEVLSAGRSDMAIDRAFLPSSSGHTSWSVLMRHSKNLFWAF
jgi:hypothetical protein